jgi:hypothetical protein
MAATDSASALKRNADAEVRRSAEQSRLQSTPRRAASHDQFIESGVRTRAGRRRCAPRKTEPRLQRRRVGHAERGDRIAVIVLKQAKGCPDVTLLAQHAAECIDQFDANRGLQRGRVLRFVHGRARRPRRSAGEPRAGYRRR